MKYEQRWSRWNVWAMVAVIVLAAARPSFAAEGPQFITEAGTFDFKGKDLFITVKVTDGRVEADCRDGKGQQRAEVKMSVGPQAPWFIYSMSSSTYWVSNGEGQLWRTRYSGNTSAVTMSTENIPDLYKQAPTVVQKRYLAQLGQKR